MTDEHSTDVYWHPETTDALTTMVIERHKERRIQRVVWRTWPLLLILIAVTLVAVAFKIIDALL